jgi:nitrate/nitrite-specific signal transduction histidine kinase
MSLQQKVSLLGGIGFLVLFGLLGFMGIRALRESTQRTFQERVVIAQMIAQGISQALEEAAGHLERFAALESADLENGDLAAEREAIGSLYRYSRVFSKIFLLNAKGELLFSHPATGQPPPTHPRTYANVARTLKDGATHISSLPPTASQPPTFSLSAALRARDGRLVGVVGGIIDLSRHGVSGLIQPIKLGETAYTEIVNERGMVMASTKGRGSSLEETEYAAHFATLIQAGKAAQETCYRCHQSGGEISRRKDVLAFAPLTVLDGIPGGVAIRQSEEEALAPTRKLERDMLLVGGPIFLIGLALLWMGTRGLVRPIAQLTLASQSIAQGDLDTPIIQTRRDELGILARTFEQMRVKLKESLEEREERVRESESRAQHLSALNAVAATMGQSLDLGQILNDSLDKVLETMKLEAGGIFLREEGTGQLSLEAQRGASRGFLEGVARIGEEGAIAAQGRLQTGLSPSPSGRGACSFATVPLTSKGKLLGTMVLVGPEQRQFTPQEIDLLTAIGHQMGVGIDNAQLFGRAQRREREAEALYGIGVEVSRLLDLDKVLNSVVGYAQELLGAEVATLALLDEPSQEICIRATSGPVGQALRQIRLWPGQGVAGRAIRQGQPAMTSDFLSDSSLVHTPEIDSLIREAGIRAVLSVPLKIGERVFGSLTILHSKAHHFSDSEVGLLSQLANQAAVAMENARLYNQVQDMAVLEERDRIAREMHDGLGQVLGFLNLKARMVGDLLDSGQGAEAHREVEEMRKVTRDAYEEVRQGILGLRAKVSPEASLISMLEDYVEGFRHQSGIPVEITVADEAATRFPPGVAVQMVRVIQEALANVRKHAQAGKVFVRFIAEGNEAQIEVEDDGIGFDPTAFDGHDRWHFGLQTMQERAESVGGSLRVDSAPGRGTRVVVKLPLSPEGGD